MELVQNCFKFNANGEVEFTSITIKQRSKNKKEKRNELSEKYQRLYKIYDQIYDSLDIPLFDNREIIIFGNIIAYPDERQAEVMDTQFLSLDERIRRNEEWLLNTTKEIIENTMIKTKTLLENH